MATGRSRVRLCSPTDFSAPVCIAVRNQRSVGDSLLIFESVASVSEEWNVSPTSVQSVAGEENWSVTSYAVNATHTDEWEPTMYNSVPSNAHTGFPQQENWAVSAHFVFPRYFEPWDKQENLFNAIAWHADTWAPTNHLSFDVFTEEWEVTQYITEDSFGPVGFFFEEDWDITLYIFEDSFGPFGVVEDWEITLYEFEDSDGPLNGFEEEWDN